MKGMLRECAVGAILGLVLTVGLAWACLLRSELKTARATVAVWLSGPPAAGWPPPQGAVAEIGTGVRIIDQSVESSFLGPAGEVSGVGGGDVTVEPLPDDADPVTAALAVESLQKQRESILHQTVVDCGWPWLALRLCDATTETSSATGSPTVARLPLSLWRSGLPIGSSSANGSRPSRLPIRPMWPGCVADWALFSAAGLAAWRVRRLVRFAYRRRCGLCTRCGYPRGETTICTECGAPVKPWNGRASVRLPRAVPASLLWLTGTAAVLGTMFMAATVWWGLYLKAPGGWYGAIWRGQIAVGRSRHAFQQLGPEVQRFAGPVHWWFDWRADLIGSRVGLPLWLPAAAFVGLVLWGWWSSAVRKGLAHHHVFRSTCSFGSEGHRLIP